MQQKGGLRVALLRWDGLHIAAVRLMLALLICNRKGFRLAAIRCASLTREIDLVVFDKDGTLIDFDFTWGSRGHAAIDAIVAENAHRASLRTTLLTTIGLDPRSGRALPESPLVVGTLGEVAVVAATVLHQAGEAWSQAIASATHHVRRIMAPPPRPDEVRALAAVEPLFRALQHAGIKIAVLTNDDRFGTIRTLTDLGLMDMLAGVVGADDGHGAKPEPGGLVHLAESTATPMDRVAMVGDSIGDLVTARRAGAALAVGVLSGAASRLQLQPHADVILEHIGHIEVLDG
jgi:HAD superfamily hydrolase (TIGR01549 family)